MTMRILPDMLFSSLGHAFTSFGELLIGGIGISPSPNTSAGDKEEIMQDERRLSSNNGTSTSSTLLRSSGNKLQSVEDLVDLNANSNPNSSRPKKKNQFDDKCDIELTVPEIIQKYGYPFESHEIKTEDGYIISIFRIPYGRGGPPLKSRGPVLLVHGLLNSAGAWIMHDTDKALAYMLADRGYDCWLLNCRGSTYSRLHEKYKDCDKEYWEFSFHEMGVYDVPSAITHILTTTGERSLYYIGHSLGNSKLMIAIDADPSLVEKIRLLICFAPAVYLYKTTAKILSLNAPFYRQQKAFLDFFGFAELMGKTFLEQVKTLLGGWLISSPERWAAKCVTASMYTMGGYNPEQIYWDKLPIVAAHTPSSSSVRTYIHCIQYFVNDKFQQYDYGSEEANMKEYGVGTPPKYDLTKVKCPTVIFYGENDLLCRPETVIQLSQELPNVKGCYRVACDKFSHTDFLYGKDVDSLVYNMVVDLLL